MRFGFSEGMWGWAALLLPHLADTSGHDGPGSAVIGSGKEPTWGGGEMPRPVPDTALCLEKGRGGSDTVGTRSGPLSTDLLFCLLNILQVSWSCQLLP